MSYVLTLVASEDDRPLVQRHLGMVEESLKKHDTYQTCAPVWLSEGKAVDIGIPEKPSRPLVQSMRTRFDRDKIDVFVSGIERRRKKLLIADMDSTIVEGETLDDLAEYAGVQDQVAGITRQAMEGNLDFHQAIRERVKLLQGLSTDALQKTLEGVRFNDGAHSLVKTMAGHGAVCVLVSGGFTFFTSAVAAQAGFHRHHGNVLGVEKDILTGEVEGAILDKNTKVDYLHRYTKQAGIKPDESMAIGDGANDLLMLKAAGLGIGYKPKQIVADEIDNVIRHGDLAAALYAQGYMDHDWR